MPLFRSKAEQKLVERGLDPARLPPGQYLTEKWPVLHAGSVPNTDLATWSFEVFGEVEHPRTLTWDELRELPASEITVDIHCVTRWSRFDARFRGVHWRELAKLVEPKPHARFAVAHAEQGFTSNVPLEALEADDALVDLAPEARCPGEDPQELELLLADGRLARVVQQLDRGLPVVPVRDAALLAERDRRDVLLELDLAARAEPHPQQLLAHPLAELGLRQEQEILRSASPDRERRDHASLRREEQGLAPVTRDVVREHPLEQILGVGAADGDIRTRAAGESRGHLVSLGSR